MAQNTWRDIDPRSLPTIRRPKLYADDNDAYFSRFDGNTRSSPLEDLEALGELLQRLEKLDGLVEEVRRENLVAFNVVAGGLSRKQKERQAGSWWDIAPETLSANELLFLICYPFFDRWGGSWEVRFALSGDLGKYLSLYKRKLQSEPSEG